MIEYELKDKDDNTYSLNGSAVSIDLKDTWTQGGDTFEYDNKILDKTFLPGSTLVGSSRLTGRSFTLEVTRTNSSSSDYRTELNQLLEFISRTKYLVDITNNMEIEIVAEEASVEYQQGSLKHLSSNKFEFIALTPYWQDLTEDTVTGTASADTIAEVAVNNQGFLTSPPIITLETTAAVNSIQLYLSSSSVGIQVDDNLFGTSGNLTMIINCINGEVTIGTVNRNDSILEGTGFFGLIVGSDTLNILAADEDVDYTIDFYKRYFV